MEPSLQVARAKLHRRRLIVYGAAFTVLAASLCVLVMRRRRRRSAPCSLLPSMRPLQCCRTCCHSSTVMGILGFTREQFLVALLIVEGRSSGAVFLTMSEPHHVLWIKQILANKL
ncbi:unnamed protein product [Urochloa humidicola]